MDSARRQFPTPNHEKVGEGALQRRSITAAVTLLLGCAALVALFSGSSERRSALVAEPYPHDRQHAAEEKLAEPVQTDEIAVSVCVCVCVCVCVAVCGTVCGAYNIV